MPTIPSKPPAPSSLAPLELAYYLDLTGVHPDSVLVYDDQGNNNEWRDMEVEAPAPDGPEKLTVPVRDSIPDVTWFTNNDNWVRLMFPVTRVYTVTFSSSTGGVLVEVIRGDGEVNERAVRYNDVLAPAGTKLHIVLRPDAPEPLRRDDNGDGIFETIIPPLGRCQRGGGRSGRPCAERCRCSSSERSGRDYAHGHRSERRHKYGLLQQQR